MIKQQKIIDKNKIIKELMKWNQQFIEDKIDLSPKECGKMINNIFADYDIFDIIKKITRDKGINKEKIRLAEDQYIETAGPGKRSVR